MTELEGGRPDRPSGVVVDPVDILDSRTAGRRVIRGGALRVAGYVAGILLGIASAALLLRYLDAEEFGRYAVVTSLIAIVASFSEAGLSSIAVREFTARESGEREVVMQNLLALRIGLVVLGIGAAVVFGVGVGYDGTMIAGSAIAGVGLLLLVAQQTYSIPLGVGLRIPALTAIELVRQALTVGAIAIVVVAGGGLLSLLAVPIPVGAIVLALTVPMVYRLIPLLPRFDLQVVIRMTKMVAAYSAATAVGTIYVFAPMVAVSLLASEEETGFFGAAFRIFQVPAAIPLLVVGVAFPVLVRAARDDRVRLVYAVQRLLEVALLGGAWMALATYFFAPAAIDLVAGKGYEPAVAILQTLGFALLGGFIGVTLGLTLLATTAHRAILVCNTVALAVVVTLTALLVPRVGADGAAIALIAADAVLVASYGWAWFRQGWTRFDMRVVPRVLIAGGLAGALAAIPGVPKFALGIAATGVYLAVVLLLRAVPGELREAFGTPRAGSGLQEEGG